MRFRVVSLIACLVSLTTIGTAVPEAPFTIMPDVQYCTGDGSLLLMDIFIPNRRIVIPTPAVLWIHGGGWAQGDKSGNSGAQFLANGGFVTASLTYRLSGDSAGFRVNGPT